MIVLKKKKKDKQSKNIMIFIIEVSIINIVVLCLFWWKKHHCDGSKLTRTKSCLYKIKLQNKISRDHILSYWDVFLSIIFFTY